MNSIRPNLPNSNLNNLSVSPENASASQASHDSGLGRGLTNLISPKKLGMPPLPSSGSFPKIPLNSTQAFIAAGAGTAAAA